MKKVTGFVSIACAMLLALAPNAFAAPGDTLLRIRAANIDFNSSSSAGALSANAISASNKIIPEVDASYFFTNNIAAELVLTYPQTVGINLHGASIGSVKALPPTLTVQYHFMPDSASFRPYVGAGINYTYFSNVSLNAGGTPLKVSRSSTGGALQAGFDIPFGTNMLFNVDVKKIYMKTDVSTAGGTYLSTLKLDPVLISVGLGWKF